MAKTYQIPYKYEAMLFDGSNLDELKAFVGEDASIHFFTDPSRIGIELDGYMVLIDVGDYVIKDYLGEIIVNSEERFNKYFEEIENG